MPSKANLPFIFSAKQKDEASISGHNKRRDQDILPASVIPKERLDLEEEEAEAPPSEVIKSFELMGVAS